MAVAWEAFSETTSIAGGVAENTPYDFSILISKSPLRSLPYNVWDGRGFVKKHEYPATLIMEPGKSLCVSLAPWDHVHSPRSLVLRVTRVDGCCGKAEVLLSEEEVEPLSKFGPGFGFELCFSVSGNNSAGVGSSSHRPEDKP